jgi:hypothetical protein
MFIFEISTIYLITLIAFKVKFGSFESRSGQSETGERRGRTPSLSPRASPPV